ncbi:MAG: gamma-glutamylcyclotransferase [Paracoccaceae bacterium]
MKDQTSASHVQGDRAPSASPDRVDPFSRHPELRGKIIDPATSFFRSHQPGHFDEELLSLGIELEWRYSDEVREANRRAFLKGRFGQDLWVFAYGSLMADPGFYFVEVRQGHVRGYERRFCLKDTFGWRGSPDRPGLMAGLDRGRGCNGLLFRIAADQTEVESEVVWRREAVSDAYLPTFVTVDTADGPVEALTFVANRASADIVPDLCREEVVRFIATGRGLRGTSLEYLEAIVAQFAVLGISDAELAGLLAEVRAFDGQA